jgi:hypothetical protein
LVFSGTSKKYYGLKIAWICALYDFYSDEAVSNCLAQASWSIIAAERKQRQGARRVV